MLLLKTCFFLSPHYFDIDFASAKFVKKVNYFTKFDFFLQNLASLTEFFCFASVLASKILKLKV